MPGLHRSHVWSKLLVEVEEVETTAWERAELGLVPHQVFNVSGKSIVLVLGTNGTIPTLAGNHNGGAVRAGDRACGEMPAEVGTGVTAFN